MKKKSKVITKKKKRQTQVSSGFTLIELLATIAILSVILSIVIYFAMDIVGNAKKKSYQVTVNNVETQAGNYVLEDFASMIWMPGGDSSYQYQCITVKNLIDAGYFKGDVLESKVDDDRFVLDTDYVYLERDSSSKTITKNVLLVGKGASYSGLCSAISATGRINMNVNPTGWIKDKKVITIDYRLYNYGDISNYLYDYIFENDRGVVVEDFAETSFSSSSVKQNVEVIENGTLCAMIKKKSDGTLIASKCQDITGIDKVAPTGTILSTNNVSGKQTVTLTMKDNASGVDMYYFGKSNPNTSSVDWLDVANAKSVTKTTVVDSEGKYYLGVKDAVGNQSVVDADFYKTILSINNGSVTPNVIITKLGNSFTIPTGIADAYYTFNGWYTSSSYSGSTITNYTPLANASYTNTLYGKTTENRLTGGVVTISGTNAYGETLTASITQHTTPQADKYAYQWYMNSSNSTTGGTAISGAAKNTLILQKEQVGKYIYVVVTATKSNYRGTTFANKTSNVVAKRTITVVAVNDSKVYDGTALTNNGCDATSGLLSGHNVNCTMTSGSTITNVGSVDNVINTVSIKDSSGVDYSNYYQITKTKGKLTITKKLCVCNISDYSKNLKYPETTSGSISYSCTGDGELYVKSGTTSVITTGTVGNTSTGLTAKGVGTSKITIGRNESSNYEACSISQDVSVSKTTYTINYYTYDGNTKLGSSTHTYNEEKTLSTMSTLEGSAPNVNVKFYGWSTSANNTTRTYTDGQKVVVSGTLNLYAIWRSEPVQITYYSGVNKATIEKSSTYYYYNNDTGISITNKTPKDITSWDTVGWRDDATAGDKDYSSNTSTKFSSSTNLYAVYKRTLTINYNGNGSTSGSVSPTTKTVYLNTSSTTTSSQTVTLASNEFSRTGYAFSKWAVVSANGTQYAAGASYTPGVAYNATTFGTTMYAVWSDTAKPVITFSPDGSSNKWIKTASSKITVTDSGSGVDSTTLKYVFSKSKTLDLSGSVSGEVVVATSAAVEDEIAKFINEGTYTLSGKNGIYYLHAYACDNSGNCTTKVSKEFKLDNIPPTIQCDKSKVKVQHYYDSDNMYHDIVTSDGYKTNYLLNNTYRISYDSDCSVFFYMEFTSGYLTESGCSDVFVVSDNVGVTSRSCNKTSYLDEDGYSRGVRQSDGISCIIRATSCNCVKGYCNHMMKYTVKDEAGNQTVGQFNYYFMYDDAVSLRDSYCNSDGTASREKYVCNES